MIVSISQPTFFPWLGYFDIIKNSNKFVFLDNVKFEKRSWQMRNRLKFTSKNEEKETWINIPTKIEKNQTLIQDVLIDNTQNWQKKHQTMFQSLYGGNYQKINFLTEMYEKDWQKLVDFNINFIQQCCDFLGITTTLYRSSELNVAGKKSKLLLEICKKLDASEYLSTIGSQEYLDNDKEFFLESNIQIKYHKYTHPQYSQKGTKFIPQLSILDLIFNEQKNAKNYF